MKTLTQIDKDIRAIQKLRREANDISLSIKAKDKLYNVCWYIGGICKEIIAYNKPKGVALGIKWTKETSTHKSGKIILVLQS